MFLLCFCCVFLCLTGFDCVWLGLTGFDCVLLGFTGFFWSTERSSRPADRLTRSCSSAVMDLISESSVIDSHGSLAAVSSSIDFHQRIFFLAIRTSLYWLLLGYTGFYWNLLDFAENYQVFTRVIPVATGFCLFLLCFSVFHLIGLGVMDVFDSVAILRTGRSNRKTPTEHRAGPIDFCGVFLALNFFFVSFFVPFSFFSTAPAAHCVCVLDFDFLFISFASSVFGSNKQQMALEWRRCRCCCCCCCCCCCWQPLACLFLVCRTRRPQRPRLYPSSLFFLLPSFQKKNTVKSRWTEGEEEEEDDEGEEEEEDGEEEEEDVEPGTGRRARTCPGFGRRCHLAAVFGTRHRKIFIFSQGRNFQFFYKTKVNSRPRLASPLSLSMI